MSSVKKSEMEVAIVTIGVHHDTEGRPLITANGMLVSTVDKMREIIAEYDPPVSQQTYMEIIPAAGWAFDYEFDRYGNIKAAARRSELTK